MRKRDTVGARAVEEAGGIQAVSRLTGASNATVQRWKAGAPVRDARHLLLLVEAAEKNQRARWVLARALVGLSDAEQS